MSQTPALSPGTPSPSPGEWSVHYTTAQQVDGHELLEGGGQESWHSKEKEIWGTVLHLHFSEISFCEVSVFIVSNEG